MTKRWLSVVVGSMLMSGTALADSITPVIDNRIDNQEQRIENGINSGQLTDREAARTNRRLDRIEHAEANAKADGHVTKQERKRLNRALDHNSRAIHRQKHDRQNQ